MKSSGTFPIGTVAERFGIATSVLRHWDAEGLLVPAARISGRRRYSEGDVYRAAAILQLKDAGCSLAEIRLILGVRSPSRRRALLERKRAELIRRIAQAEAASGMIAEVLQCEARDPIACQYFQAWLQPLTEGGGSRRMRRP